MIVSSEGLPIASALPRGIDETRMAATTAALLSLAERSVIEMEKGKFEQLYIRGEDGYLLALPAGPNAILMVSTKRDVRLGLIFLDLKRTVENIARLLSGSYIPDDFDDDDDNGYVTPFPFTPPGPPGSAGSAEKVYDEEEREKSKYEPTCKHCGARLVSGQSICHVCSSKVI